MSGRLVGQSLLFKIRFKVNQFSLQVQEILHIEAAESSDYAKLGVLTHENS